MLDRAELSIQPSVTITRQRCCDPFSASGFVRFGPIRLLATGLACALKSRVLKQGRLWASRQHQSLSALIFTHSQ